MQVPEQILSEHQKVLGTATKNYSNSNMKLPLGHAPTKSFHITIEKFRSSKFIKE